MAGYTLSEGAVRKLAGLVRGGMESTRRGASSPSAVSFDGYALPFAVRWAASEGQSGAWVVWLPTLANLVSYAGAACTLSGVAAATSLPAGWYTVEDAATAVYLVITVADSTGAASAELSATPGTAATGETVYNLLVAAMATDATTGAKRVKQYIVGAIALGGGGGGGDVTVGTPKTAATSIEYTDGYDASHPYAIKLTRGYLAASANTLTIDPQDGGTGTTANLTQYIDTMPISSVVTADSLIPST